MVEDVEAVKDNVIDTAAPDPVVEEKQLKVEPQVAQQQEQQTVSVVEVKEQVAKEESPVVEQPVKNEAAPVKKQYKRTNRKPKTAKASEETAVESMDITADKVVEQKDSEKKSASKPKTARKPRTTRKKTEENATEQ